MYSKTEQTSENPTQSSIYKLIQYIAVSLFPSIFLLDLFNRNRDVGSIFFDHVIVLSMVLAIISIVIFFTLKRIMVSIESAVLVIILFWIFFWLFETLHGATAHYIPSRGLLLLLGIGIVFVVVCFTRYKPSFMKAVPIFSTLSVAIICMFIFNLVPGIHDVIRRHGRYNIKREFNVDNKTPSPNIFWLHMDGMMSFATVESFFGICQNHNRVELEKRGFLMYEDGRLVSGQTSVALATLLSPALYDSYFSEILKYTDFRLRQPDTPVQWTVIDVNQRLRQDALCLYRDFLPYLELFYAFATAGYEVSLPDYIRDYGVFSYGTNDFIDRYHASELPDLLNRATPLSLPVVINQYPVVSHNLPNLYRQKYSCSPLFYFRHCSRASTGSWQFHDPQNLGFDVTRIDLYPFAHQHAFENMIETIDSIREEYPYAVFVLQSDHGPHFPDTRQHLLEEGYSIDKTLELLFSVFSAVSIPIQYGGLNEPLDPRNISRVLVNRFVGQNYELLPQ